MLSWTSEIIFTLKDKLQSLVHITPELTTVQLLFLINLFKNLITRKKKNHNQIGYAGTLKRMCV